ncbi:MAG TPA: glycosyltransferase family 2 protein [Thermoanaerobaculia bacterium]|nr:glycosyltransferase family 2 protein [Thermoanaerobaculia bacterium]
MRVSAIIAAYNEEQTLAEVISALRKSPLIDEIVVVSDGSTDRTVAVAREQGVRTIALLENQGKGCAMRVGVEHARGRVLFFVDGDMLNLTGEHIEALVLPVLDGRCDMNVGVRHRGPVRNFLHLKVHVGPVLSGIRVMKSEVFHSVPVQYMERFKIELALNYFCSRNGLRQWNTVVRDLGHVIKEQKRGIGDGLAGRLRMTREVALLHFDLYLFQSWKWARVADRPRVEYETFEG